MIRRMRDPRRRICYHVQMSTPEYQRARRHLGRRCLHFRELIRTVGPCTLVPRPDSPYALLIGCIVSQQISTAAARTITARLNTAAGGALTPAAVAALDDDAVRGCGLSRSKVASVRAVTEFATAQPDTSRI
jgi:DNA-3-methyladenine glycosylase II